MNRVSYLDWANDPCFLTLLLLMMVCFEFWTS